MRQKKPKPIDISLTHERDKREGLTLMRPDETVTINSTDRFVVMPGPKGKGWIVRIFSDPPES